MSGGARGGEAGAGFSRKSARDQGNLAPGPRAGADFDFAPLAGGGDHSPPVGAWVGHGLRRSQLRDDVRSLPVAQVVRLCGPGLDPPATRGALRQPFATGSGFPSLGGAPCGIHPGFALRPDDLRHPLRLARRLGVAVARADPVFRPVRHSQHRPARPVAVRRRRARAPARHLAIAVLAALHVAGALKHHFVDRDDVLTRMAPRRREPRPRRG